MKIKKYVADSMPAALKLVRDDLGPRAVILNTRTVARGGLLGKKGQVEVTAAIDETRKASPPEQRRTTRREGATRETTAAASPTPKSSARPAVGSSRPTAPGARAADVAAGGDWAARLSGQMEELRSALSSGGLAAVPRLPGALAPLARQMEEDGLAQDISQSIVEEILMSPGPEGLKESGPVRKRAAGLVAGRMAGPKPFQLPEKVRTIVALVGPSGAGKTTAVAKLAAHFLEQKGAQVALISADTDRVGGLAQIKAYAEILGIPLDVAYTPEDMREVIQTRKDADLILIDTAGASPLAKDQLKELGELLREAAPNEIHLTLSATMGLRQMRDAHKAFSAIGVDRLLFTHLDETARFGTTCSIAAETGIPMSFITCGRAVPGDLREADPRHLAAALFNRSLNGATDRS